MSTKSKLLAMTENLQLPADAVPAAPTPDAGTSPAAASGGGTPTPPNAAQPPRFPPVTPATGARTGPGQMLQFRGQMLAVEGELEKLRGQLKQHEGAAATKKLDPSVVVPSRWANRHPASFDNPEFMRLKHDIEIAGGNVQAISVRPLPDRPGHYEIVFGHRRHRACAELGLPVLATIVTDAVSDLELFSAMDRENRERADLSPFEQGTMYRRALDEKLYPSNRRLAEALGVSHTWVANVLLVADLPPPVLDCFRTPLEVQHRHAKAIAAAIDGDRKGVLRRAEKLRHRGKDLSAKAVVEALTAASEEAEEPAEKTLAVGGKPVGKWFKDRAGRLNIQIAAGVVDDAALDAFAQALVDALAQPR